MLTPQLIEKMNQLKTLLDANPDFIETLKNPPHESEEHPLIAFAQQNGITISLEEFNEFFTSLDKPNQILDDTALEPISGGVPDLGGMLVIDGKLVPNTGQKSFINMIKNRWTPPG